MDNFEKKTEKLRAETEKILKGNNINYVWVYFNHLALSSSLSTL